MIFQPRGSVVEVNPEKQGLKHEVYAGRGMAVLTVVEVNPEKQGLKPCGTPIRSRARGWVVEVNPEKQGLKHRFGHLSLRLFIGL